MSVLLTVGVLIFISFSTTVHSERLFDQCRDNSTCPTGSMCIYNWCDGRVCVCQDSNFPSADKSKCVPGIKVGGECNQSAVCKDPSSECQDGVCVCKFGFFKYEASGRCLEKSLDAKIPVDLDDECNDVQVCAFDLECVNNKCACPDKYRLATEAEIIADPYINQICRPQKFSLGTMVDPQGPSCNRPTTTSSTSTTTPTTTTRSTSTFTTTSTSTTSTTQSTTAPTTTPTTTSSTAPTTTTKTATTPTAITNQTTTTTTTTPKPTTSTTPPTTTTTKTTTFPPPPTTTKTSTQTTTIQKTTSPTTTTTKTTTLPTPTTTTQVIPVQKITSSTTTTTTTTSTPLHKTTTTQTTTSTQPSTTSTTSITTPTLLSTTTTKTTTTTQTTTTSSSPTTPTITTTELPPNITTQTTTSTPPTSTTTTSTPTTSTTTPTRCSTVSSNSSVPVGSSCGRDERCPENADCERDSCEECRCRCSLGYATSPDGTECWKLAALGDSCVSKTICQGPFTQCDVGSGVCQCADEYERSDSGRWCRLQDSWFVSFPLVGEKCSGGFFSACYMDFEQTCVNGRCICHEGLRPLNDDDRAGMYPDIVQCRNASIREGNRERALCKNQSAVSRDLDRAYSRAKAKIRTVQGAIIGGSVGLVALIGIIIGIVALFRWKRRGRRQTIRDTSSMGSTDGQSSRYSFKIPRPFASFNSAKEFQHISYPNIMFESDDPGLPSPTSDSEIHEHVDNGTVRSTGSKHSEDDKQTRATYTRVSNND